MPCIAIIDDDVSLRDTVFKLIKQQLAKQKKADTWEVIQHDPLPELEDYDGWIQENEVSVLVLDERLDEKTDGDAVEYAGHQVAQHLRARHRDLPQFIVTSVESPEENFVQDSGDLEAVVSRTAFARLAGMYVQRMVRLGQTFYEEYEKQLARLSELSEKAVTAHLTERDASELGAIRQAVLVTSLPAGLDETLGKADEILTELRSVVVALNAARQSGGDK